MNQEYPEVKTDLETSETGESGVVEDTGHEDTSVKANDHCCEHHHGEGNEHGHHDHEVRTLSRRRRI